MEQIEDRQVYLIRFLRGCATAVDRGEVGVDQGQLLVNGELMREAADEFEKLRAPNAVFGDVVAELRYNLFWAEQHAQKAFNLVYKKGGPKRSFWFRAALGRAQSILMSLHNQELSRRNDP